MKPLKRREQFMLQRNGSNATGIEGTISQAVRAFGLRQTRYRELAKTHLQNLAIAAAMNIRLVGQ